VHVCAKIHGVKSMKELDPLQRTLEAILSRLCALEAASGITPPVTADPSSCASQSQDTSSPAVQAFETHIQTSLQPLIQACDTLKLSTVGSNLSTIWQTMKAVIELASKCQKPKDVPQALSDRKALEPIQNAMQQVRKLRIDRKFDWHLKALQEMLASVSWLVMTSPPAPCNFIKDTVGSSDFWSNKIRKEYKRKEGEEATTHITFCDSLKKLILDLSAYVKEYHLSGLLWNVNGVPIQEYLGDTGSGSGDGATTDLPATKDSKALVAPTSKGVGIMAGLGAELAKKRTGDGSSAATGLRKVTRDQQTWRKEFKKQPNTETIKPSAVKPSQIKAHNSAKSKTEKVMSPKCEFKALGSKWNIEYQTSTSNPNGVCTIDIKDVKEQAYIYKCSNATIQIKGKLKSIVLDSCTKTNVIFSSAITSCEIVNSKSVQIQSTGVCPSFAIDKTDGCLVYLSAEGASVSAFVTSKSTEMNVSWQDESGEQVERPIPEQFVHKIMKGNVASQVSDIYH